MEYKPHGYQAHATEHIVKNPEAGLFMEMGLGKTVATLTAIDRLIYEDFEVDRVLIIAPLRVAEITWTDEIEKWDHLKHLKVVKILGKESARKAALLKKGDIYLINRENVPWLVSYLQGNWIFDMIVVDELSSFKSAKSARFRALRKVRPRSKRVVGLTGTPSPNGLIDLWSQVYLLDMGKRLGQSITNYRNVFFVPGKSNGHVVYNYRLRPESEKAIYDRIGDICISMKAKDYLELPERIDVVKKIEFTEETKKLYHQFERTEILKLAEETEISVANAAALTNKLLQFSNGAVYDENRKVWQLHDEKLDVLEELIEEAGDTPVLVFYSYKHDIDRIKNRLGKSAVLLEDSSQISDWNKKKIKILLAHPASAGHGLNMQDGGNVIVWFGLPWSLELYQQAVARLHRQGQRQVVSNYMLVCKGTMDEDVYHALSNKSKGQESLMEAVKAKIAAYLENI